MRGGGASRAQLGNEGADGDEDGTEGAGMDVDVLNSMELRGGGPLAAHLYSRGGFVASWVGPQLARVGVVDPRVTMIRGSGPFVAIGGGRISGCAS